MRWTNKSFAAKFEHFWSNRAAKFFVDLWTISRLPPPPNFLSKNFPKRKLFVDTQIFYLFICSSNLFHFYSCRLEFIVCCFKNLSHKSCDDFLLCGKKFASSLASSRQIKAWFFFHPSSNKAVSSRWEMNGTTYQLVKVSCKLIDAHGPVTLTLWSDPTLAPSRWCWGFQLS